MEFCPQDLKKFEWQNGPSITLSRSYKDLTFEGGEGMGDLVWARIFFFQTSKDGIFFPNI